MTDNRLLCCLYEGACLGDPSGVNHLYDCAGGCLGTSRVPLLPGVRVPCWDDYDYHAPAATCVEGEIRPDCSTCHGLGWTPSEDAWVWLDTFFALDGRIKVAILRLLADGWKLRFKEAFYAALESALRPLACNVAEAQRQGEVT